MSPHKAEARFIGTILVIAAASCLVSAVGGLAAAATRGDWIVVAALALVLAPTPFAVWVVATAWRRYTGRADHCIDPASVLAVSVMLLTVGVAGITTMRPWSVVVGAVALLGGLGLAALISDE